MGSIHQWGLKDSGSLTLTIADNFEGLAKYSEMSCRLAKLGHLCEQTEAV